jgi:hypothetical protein
VHVQLEHSYVTHNMRLTVEHIYYDLAGVVDEYTLSFETQLGFGGGGGGGVTVRDDDVADMGR